MAGAWHWCMEATARAMSPFRQGLCCGNITADRLPSCGGQHEIKHHHATFMVDATGKNVNQQNGKSMDHLASIEAFVAVARFESFTKAASHLKTSPGALSRAISNLEAHTQVTLFH